MLESYVTKIFFVDQTFMDDLKERSLSDYEEFNSPAVDTRIVTLPLSNEQIGELAEVVDASAIRAGSIVVKPKFSQDFVPVDEFTEDMVLRKYSLFVQLCVLLGAKSVSISSVEGVALDSSAHAIAKGEASIGGIGVSADASVRAANSSLSQSLQASIMQLNTQARGGEPDLIAAQDLLGRHGLQRDALFNGLFSMRQSRSNQLQRHAITLDFAKDASRVFDSSMDARINVMSKLYKGKAEFEQTKKSVERNRISARLNVLVEF